MPDLILRRPPAFQLYASDLRSDPRFMLMSATERGVMLSMMCAAWVADEIPADPEALARILSMSEAEVRAGLSERVLNFFRPVPGPSRALFSPELSGQMETLLARRRERAESGRKGGRATQSGRVDTDKVTDQSSPSSSASSGASSSEGSSLSRAEQNRNEANALVGRADKKNVVVPPLDPFVADIIAAEQANDVLSAGYRNRRG